MAEHAPLLAEMAALAAAHADALAAPVRAFDIGGRPFDPDVHPELMGVVNLSRDSWYRESVVPSAAGAHGVWVGVGVCAHTHEGCAWG